MKNSLKTLKLKKKIVSTLGLQSIHGGCKTQVPADCVLTGVDTGCKPTNTQLPD